MSLNIRKTAVILFFYRLGVLFIFCRWVDALIFTAQNADGKSTYFNVAGSIQFILMYIDINGCGH